MTARRLISEWLFLDLCCAPLGIGAVTALPIVLKVVQGWGVFKGVQFQQNLSWEHNDGKELHDAIGTYVILREDGGSHQAGRGLERDPESSSG